MTARRTVKKTAVKESIPRKPATKRPAAKKPAARPRAAKAAAGSASRLITARIAELGDWRGDVLRRVRRLVLEAGPEITEEWKWGIPVWSHHGILTTGETYKQVVKLTFARGAALSDPARLFNSSLEGNVRRAIDIREGEAIDEPALQALIRAAAAHNLAERKG